MSRRKFLKNSAHLAMSSAYFYGLQSLLETCIRSNFAHAAGLNGDLRYVSITNPGGPPRWYFDLPLNPRAVAGDMIGGNFGTEIVKRGAKFAPVHRAYKMKFGSQTVALPPVWRLKSAASGENFSKLLNHTLMIRGVDMEINSHTLNRTRTVRPVSSAPSITGLVADNSSLPISAAGFIGAANTRGFKSEKGKSIVAAQLGNPIPAVQDAFKGEVTKASDLPHSVTQIMDSLDDYAGNRGISSREAEKVQMAAYEMFDRNIERFNAEWTRLFKKYTDIISAELNAVFPGVTNVNPVSDGGPLYQVTNGGFVRGSLNSSIDAKTMSVNLARSFAFAEFALLENLSASLSLNTGGTILQGVKGPGNIICDQHFVGAVASIFYTSLFYRAQLGCLMALTKALKDAGIFDKTVIQLTAEFSRTPRVDGSGSDHGFNGSSSTIISGMIDEPGLIGNIRKQPAGLAAFRAKYPGTWGMAANFFPAAGGSKARPILNDDVVNTLCEMLDIRKVAVKGASLVKKSGGRVSWAKKWGARNV